MVETPKEQKMTQIKAETDRIINKLCFKDGDTVSGGDEILQTELMKMAIPVVTPAVILAMIPVAIPVATPAVIRVVIPAAMLAAAVLATTRAAIPVMTPAAITAATAVAIRPQR